jgi:steroid delta-isomerase-like uncharacterized protein
LSAEQPAAHVRRAFELLNEGNIDALVACFAPEMVNHTLSPTKPLNSAALREMFMGLRRAFPDLRITLEEVVAERDMVAVRETWRGTHREEFRGVAPTGLPFAFSRMHFFRLRGGMIVDEWSEGNIPQKLAE